MKSEITNSEPKVKTQSALKESGFATVEIIFHLKDSHDQLKKANGQTQGIDSRC